MILTYFSLPGEEVGEVTILSTPAATGEAGEASVSAVVISSLGKHMEIDR